MLVHDIHSHTYYSACGKDRPELTIREAIEGGLSVFGYSDHNYGIGFDRMEQYRAEMRAVGERHKDEIGTLVGVEIATVFDSCLQMPEYTEGFDFCLIEHIDRGDSFVGRDIFKYREKLKTRAGIAHTDLVSLAPRWGMTPKELLTEFAKNDIFWEMNVSYDRIHGFRRHGYVMDLLRDRRIQEAVAESGIRVSVGFDGHRFEDYKPYLVRDMCAFLQSLDIPAPDFVTSLAEKYRRY